MAGSTVQTVAVLTLYVTTMTVVTMSVVLATDDIVATVDKVATVDTVATVSIVATVAGVNKNFSRVVSTTVKNRCFIVKNRSRSGYPPNLKGFLVITSRK